MRRTLWRINSWLFFFFFFVFWQSKNHILSTQKQEEWGSLKWYDLRLWFDPPNLMQAGPWLLIGLNCWGQLTKGPLCSWSHYVSRKFCLLWIFTFLIARTSFSFPLSFSFHIFFHPRAWLRLMNRWTEDGTTKYVALDLSKLYWQGIVWWQWMLRKYCKSSIAVMQT